MIIRLPYHDFINITPLLFFFQQYHMKVKVAGELTDRKQVHEWHLSEQMTVSAVVLGQTIVV